MFTGPRAGPPPSFEVSMTDPSAAPRPGSAGEHALQEAHATCERARRFYDEQMVDHLTGAMTEFVDRMAMMFVATADAAGECDSSFRAGPPGFVRVLDEKRLAYPEYRGNGVMASLGNITENPRVGLLFLDLTDELIGLHVNGAAQVVDDAALRADHPGLPRESVPGRRTDLWVVVEVVEAYIHCRKHLPRLVPTDRRRSWGTDDPGRKGGDHFGVAASRSPARGSGRRTGRAPSGG